MSDAVLTGGAGPRSSWDDRPGSGAQRSLLACIALALVLVSPNAWAELPRVIVASSPELPLDPGLVEAVAIQLSGLATVEAGPELGGATAQERRLRASELASERGAVLVAWIDDGAGQAGHEGSLHVAWPAKNGEPGRVSVSPVPQGDGPEVERAVALKVREALDPPEGRPAEPTVAEPDIEPDPPGVRFAPITAFDLGVSSWGGNVGLQGDVAVAVGLARYARHGRIELVAGVRWATGTEVESTPGRVTTDELAAGLGTHYVLSFGPLAAGAHASFWMRRVAASGVAADGAAGSATRYVPVTRVGPDFRWELSPQLALRWAATSEIAIRRQFFGIYGDRVMDLGRVRLGLSVGVVTSWR